MQSEFTALQGEIHNLKNLKHEFEQAKNFKLNKCIIKWHIKFKQHKQKSQKAVHKERFKNRTFKS